jgi:hypothetical protein
MAVIQLDDPNRGMMERFLTQWMERNQQKKQHAASLAQQESQFGRSHELDQTRTNNDTRLTDTQISAADEAKKRAAAIMKIEQFKERVGDPLLKNGKRAEADQAFQRFSMENPDVQAYVATLPMLENQSTDNAAANTARFAETQTGNAAGGSPDAQARAFTQEAALGRGQSAHQFDDQVQRQGGDDAYGTFVKRQGGALPTAGQQLQANTTLQAGREQNATSERIAGMRIDAVEDRPAKPSSAIEKRALGFYLRAKDAIENLEANYEGKPLHERVGNKGLAGQVWANNAPNMLQPEENQLYTQAQRQFTEARLRKDSGAAIPEHEYENDRRTYFAQPGDGPEIIKRKQAARSNLLNSLRMEAGRAFGEHFGQEESDVTGTGASGIIVYDESGKRVQ